MANGSGDASSSANAIGGAASFGIDGGGTGGSANAMANASAGGGGTAMATAVATPGIGSDRFSQTNAQATSNAKTMNGAEAQALSTAKGVPSPEPFLGSVSASSTAQTSFAGVSIHSTAALSVTDSSVTVSTEAIAQGGSGQTVMPDVDASAISIALPTKAYATTLIDGASNVANALLGPGDIIFGTSILDSGASTFDFRYRGDLLLGVIDGNADITINGVEIFSGDPGDDTVINLGSNFGPNIDLAIQGEGVFAIGGAVPEASTWAMLLLGFAGLGFAGYRQTRGSKPQTAV